MSRVKIVNGKRKNLLERLTGYLTVALAVLTGFILIVSYQNPSITGYSVFTDTYGAASPLIIIGLLVAVIFLYTRIHK